MFEFIKRILIALVYSEKPRSSRRSFWSQEASDYLLNMDIEYKIVWLEHCLQLDCGKHYQDIGWQDHRE